MRAPAAWVIRLSARSRSLGEGAETLTPFSRLSKAFARKLRKLSQ